MTGMHNLDMVPENLVLGFGPGEPGPEMKPENLVLPTEGFGPG